MTDQLVEGLPIGIVRRTRGRTLAQAEIQLFQTLTGTTDEPHAFSTLLALMSGLRDERSIPHGLMHEYAFDVIAALAATAEMVAPADDGDTISVETRLVSARASKSRPGQGVMEIEDRCLNQRDEVLVRRRRQFLFVRTAPRGGG